MQVNSRNSTLERHTFRPRTGQEILDTLVVIYNELERRFLEDPSSRIARWPIYNRDYPGKEFKWEFFELLENLNLITKEEQHKNELPVPYWCYASNEPSYSEQELLHITPYLTIIDDKRLKHALRTGETQTTIFHLCYSIGMSPEHFHTIKQTTLNDLGYPDIIDKAFARYLTIRELLKGHKNIETTKEQLIHILEPNKINQNNTSIISLSKPTDMYAYKQRQLCVVKQKDSRAVNNFGSIDMLFGIGLRTKEGQPIGYKLFKQENEQKSIAIR